MSVKEFSFELIAQDDKARLGTILTPRGLIDTPTFMPVGTQGTVKGVLTDNLIKTGTQVILGNTYHLLLRPGVKVLNNFKGLPHRYEIFLKKKNCIFINDSKATSFQSSKFALQNTKNIFWILGGLPKKNDKIILGNLKKNIIKSYIIGKNVKFFKRQLHNKINYFVANDLEKSITQALKDIKYLKKSNNVILLSPASASFDQFKNFEKRGEKFKQLSKFYARKYI